MKPENLRQWMDKYAGHDSRQTPVRVVRSMVNSIQRSGRKLMPIPHRETSRTKATKPVVSPASNDTPKANEPS